MNKTQLIDFIADNADLSKYQANSALEAILEGITNAIRTGDQVPLIGFGTFKVNHRAARTGRNPKTGQEIHIAAANVPAFVAGKALKDSVQSTEYVRRLNPTFSTKRELFCLSGNECAYPTCSHELIDNFGHFTGHICHIEAAEALGERFNENQTNEERRDISNLILMCPTHHEVTNDVKRFTVDVLKNMKAEHEQKIRNSNRSTEIPEVFFDSGLDEHLELPNNFNALGIDLADYHPNFFEDSKDLMIRIADLPRTTRSFYLRALYRAFVEGDCSLGFDPREIEDRLICSHDVIMKHADILNRAGLLSELDDDESPRKYRYWFTTLDKDDNQIWFLNLIKEKYSNQLEILEDMILELNFNRLESNQMN